MIGEVLENVVEFLQVVRIHSWGANPLIALPFWVMLGITFFTAALAFQAAPEFMSGSEIRHYYGRNPDPWLDDTAWDCIAIFICAPILAVLGLSFGINLIWNHFS